MRGGAGAARNAPGRAEDHAASRRAQPGERSPLATAPGLESHPNCSQIQLLEKMGFTSMGIMLTITNAIAAL